MTQPEQPALEHNDFANAINRCVEAYRAVRAKLPKDAGCIADRDNRTEAGTAYLAKLPVLCDPQSFQLYVSCISHAAGIGVVDPVDVGRFCHIAQTAMSAWKLANLIVPAAQQKLREAEAKAARAANAASAANSAATSVGWSTPLPPKGNHSGENDSQNHPEQSSQGRKSGEIPPSKGNQSGGISDEQMDKAIKNALENLPRLEEQRKHFHYLRQKGHFLPEDIELRDYPLAALYFVRMSEEIQRKEILAEVAKAAQPEKEQPEAQQEPPAQAA